VTHRTSLRIWVGQAVPGSGAHPRAATRRESNLSPLPAREAQPIPKEASARIISRACSTRSGQRSGRRPLLLAREAGSASGGRNCRPLLLPPSDRAGHDDPSDSFGQQTSRGHVAESAAPPCKRHLAAPPRPSPCHTHGREAGANAFALSAPQPSGSSTAFFQSRSERLDARNWTVSRSGEFGGAKKNPAFAGLSCSGGGL
jgi:hypothetical protein